MKIFSGYNKDGIPITVTLEDGTVMIENVVTGEKEAWNDESYTEDSISIIKLSLLNEGYRI